MTPFAGERADVDHDGAERERGDEADHAEFARREHGAGERVDDAEGADRRPDRGDRGDGEAEHEGGDRRRAEAGGGLTQELESAVVLEHLHIGEHPAHEDHRRPGDVVHRGLVPPGRDQQQDRRDAE
jgi:hypothetical protein